MDPIAYSWQETGGGGGDWWDQKRIARQAKPIDYTRPLSYYTHHAHLNNASAGWYGITVPILDWNRVSTWGDALWTNTQRNRDQFSAAGPMEGWPAGAEWKRAYAKAYGKFVGSISERAQMMTNVAERGETVEMLVHRLGQFRDAGLALRKKDFRGFLAVWGVKPLPKHRNKVWALPREASGLWLEYWFGWAPTINDIYTAVETYGKPVKSDTIKFGSTTTWAQDGTHQVDSENSVYSAEKGRCTVTICGRVEVENPSLFEANRLGLVNPAATALELIPFSWLVGWFVNLQQVLNQYTDFVGLSLKDTTVSTKTSSWYAYSRHYLGTTYQISWEAKFQTYARRNVNTLPRVSIVMGLPKGLSITRGATLASLVVQFLAPVKR